MSHSHQDLPVVAGSFIHSDPSLAQFWLTKNDPTFKVFSYLIHKIEYETKIESLSIRRNFWSARIVAKMDQSGWTNQQLVNLDEDDSWSVTCCLTAVSTWTKQGHSGFFEQIRETTEAPIKPIKGMGDWQCLSLNNYLR